jgi:hypothetical protein
LSVISVIGVISRFLFSKFHRIAADIYSVEITAADTAPGTGRLAQFIVGRIVVYISVGLVEVDVT